MSYRPKVKGDAQGTITDLPLDAETVKGVDVVTQLQNKSNVGHTHSSNDITQGYLNVHPENSPTLIPFINNDISFLLKRGGSVVVKFDDVVQTTNTDSMFDGSPSYWIMNPTNITTIVIEITLHKTFGWGNTIYVDFGAAGWRAKSIKLEVMNSNYPDDVWTQKGSTTTNASGHYSVSVNHTPVGGSSAGNGFNKIRYTFSTWATATIFRIAQIGIYNYGSGSLRETSMSRGIDDYIFRSITPNANNTYTLGNSTHKWSEIHGALKGTADNASKLNNQEASYYLNYNNLTNKPTIPTAVTEATVSGWGFTKNAGTVTSVSAGTGLSISGTASTTPTVNVASGYKLLTTTEYNTLNAKVSNVQSDWNATSGLAQILNKPTIPTKSSWNYDDRYVRFDTYSQGLTELQKINARTNIGAGTSSFSGSYNDLTNKPDECIKTVPIYHVDVNNTNYIILWGLKEDTHTLYYVPEGTYYVRARGTNISDMDGVVGTFFGPGLLTISNYGSSELRYSYIDGTAQEIQYGSVKANSSYGEDSYNCSPIIKGNFESDTGSIVQPLYIKYTSPSYTDGAQYEFTKCSTYAGGTLVTLNGTSKSATTASLYAPTASGTSGQFLKSAGVNASPTWETVAIPTESTVSGWGFTKNVGTVTSVRVQAGTGLSSSTSTAQTTTLNTTISIASGYKLLTTAEYNTLNAKQDKISSLGTETKPVYFSSDGAASACLDYAGGTAVTLNGASKAASTASFYAPTSAGTSGYSLKSNGSGAPRWANSRTVQINGAISSGAKNCASVSFVITSGATEYQLSKGLWYYSGTYGVFIVYLTTAITSPGSPKTEYISGYVTSSIPNNTTITLVEL